MKRMRIKRRESPKLAEAMRELTNALRANGYQKFQLQHNTFLLSLMKILLMLYVKIQMFDKRYYP